MFNKNERKGKRVVFGIVVILFLLLNLSAGCIDMELMDAVLPHTDVENPYYAIKQKIERSYYFDTSITGAPSQLTKEFPNQEYRILDDTKWMKIEISVNLDKNDVIEKLIELSGINLTLTRHVTITLTDPKNNVWMEREFYETETIETEIVYSPLQGIWTLDVFAKGIGFEIEGYKLNDGFDIRVSVLEPT